MKSKKSQRPQNKGFRPSLIVFISFSFLLLIFVVSIIVFAFFSPKLTTNIEKYDGSEREAAQKALELSSGVSGPLITPPKFRVAKVEKVDPEGVCNDNFGEGGTIKERYAVTVEKIGILGWASDSSIIHICER